MSEDDETTVEDWLAKRRAERRERAKEHVPIVCAAPGFSGDLALLVVLLLILAVLVFT